MNRIVAIVALLALVAAFGCEEKPAADAADTSAAETTEAAEGEEGAAEGAEEETEEPEAPAESGASLPADMKPGEEQHFGADFTLEGEPMQLAAAIEKADELAGKPVKVTATMDKVCTKKGCWFTLAAEEIETTVRVRMKDYGFFVPRNAQGATAVVEGELIKKVIPQKEAQHYADESGEDVKIEGDQTEYHFTATAIDVKMADA